MVRTQIQLTEEQVNSLKRLANKLHVSLAELVRQGVDTVLRSSRETSGEERKRRAISAAGHPHLAIAVAAPDESVGAVSHPNPRIAAAVRPVDPLRIRGLRAAPPRAGRPPPGAEPLGRFSARLQHYAHVAGPSCRDGPRCPRRRRPAGNLARARPRVEHGDPHLPRDWSRGHFHVPPEAR